MKIFIEVSGDVDVGIPRQTLILIGYPEPETHSQRQEDRLLLTDCFSQIFDWPVGIRFDDECPDCGIKDGHYSDCPIMQLDGAEK